MSNIKGISLLISIILIFTSSLNSAGNPPGHAGTNSSKNKITNISYRAGWMTPEILSGNFDFPNKTTKQDACIALFEQKIDMFKINNPSEELKQLSEFSDKLNKTHIKLQQQFNELEIFGCQTIVHFNDDNSIYLVAGQTVPTPDISTIANISEDQALEEALNHLENGNNLENPKSKIKLLLYPHNKITYLAFFVEILGDDNYLMRKRIFVDAHTGEIIFAYDNLQQDGPGVGTGPDIYDSVRTFGTYDIGAKHYMIDASLPMYAPPIGNYQGVITANMGEVGNYLYDLDYDNVWDDFSLHPEGVSSQFNLTRAYNYFRDRFGRESYDNNGGTINALIHYSDPTYGSSNALYFGDGLIAFGYGDSTYLPWCGALDVVTHELAHGVTATTAGLIYNFQSGALNEHYSDFFGVMSDPDDWTIAEDIRNPGYLRNLADPHLGAVPDYFEFGYQPDHMDEYVVWSESSDNGAVHFNSGIPNKASYLAATEIGNYATEEIWYRTLTTYLTPSSSFHFWGDMTIQATIDLYGEPSAEVDAVIAALDSVGISRIYTIPFDNVLLTVLYGTTKDSSVILYNTNTNSISVDSIIANNNHLQIISPLPATVNGRENIALEFSFDATAYNSCDVEMLEDTLAIFTSSPDNPEISIPVTIAVVVGDYGWDWTSLHSKCMAIYCANTNHIDLLRYNSIDYMYQASLMIGYVSNGDTIVQKHLFLDMDFQEVARLGESHYYADRSVNNYLYTYAPLVTSDGLIQGEFRYYYDIPDRNNCKYLFLEYILTNACSDTAITFFPGIFADFDTDGGYDNSAGYLADQEIIYTRSSSGSYAAGLKYFGTPYNMRIIDNAELIWPNLNFDDTTAYKELSNPNNDLSNGSDTLGDWSSLITFDEVTLAPGDTVRFMSAILISDNGINGLYDSYHSAILPAETGDLYVEPHLTEIYQGLNSPVNPIDTHLTIDIIGESAFSWSATNLESWLTLTNPSGVAGENLNITFDASGLATGTYLDEITITTSSPQVLTYKAFVKLKIKAGDGFINVQGDALTIQQAINGATDGDVILVGPGTYTENIDYNGKEIRVIATAGPENTTLTPTLPEAVMINMSSISGVWTQFNGFTVSGMQTGTLMLIEDYSEPTITNNIFTNNFSGNTNNGFIIQVVGSTPLILNNLFYNNDAFIVIHADRYSTGFRAINNTIHNNLKWAIHNNQHFGTVLNNIITNNDRGILTSLANEDFNNIWNNVTDFEIQWPDYPRGVNTISADPEFCYPTNLDFHLSQNSPCLPENNNGQLIGAYGLGSCQYNCLNRGDINHSGGGSPIGISDLTYFVDYLFNDGPMPISYEEGDINSDGTHSISDLTFLVDYLFNNGSVPSPCSQ